MQKFAKIKVFPIAAGWKTNLAPHISLSAFGNSGIQRKAGGTILVISSSSFWRGGVGIWDPVSLIPAPNARLSFLINDFGLNLGGQSTGHVRPAMPKAMSGLVLCYVMLLEHNRE